MSNQRNPDDLKNNLTEMQFYVTQNHGTEPPFTGRLLHNKRDGVYHCLVCDAPLFTPRPSTILAVVGRAFMSRLAMTRSVTLMTRHTGCSVLKFVVVNVMPTWGMFSRTVLSLRVNVSASTQRH
jgi:hypothetical protein